MATPADPANKVAIKMDDERYLRSKPELRWLVDSFVEVRRRIAASFIFAE